MAPRNPQLAKDWKSSKIRSLCGSWNNFLGSSVQYAYDKKSKIYTAKADFNGKPYIIALRVGNEAVEIMLTDKDGNLLEHVINNGSKIVFTQKGKGN